MDLGNPTPHDKWHARQWHVDNEYHVQNLLWVLLAPIFPDLDDEQYLTKIGQKNPRADLYIPSMKLIVEAKFLRAGTNAEDHRRNFFGREPLQRNG